MAFCRSRILLLQWIIFPTHNAKLVSMTLDQFRQIELSEIISCCDRFEILRITVSNYHSIVVSSRSKCLFKSQTKSVLLVIELF